MLRRLYVTANERIRQGISDAKLLLGIYKYSLNEEGDAIVLRSGKNGILGGFIIAKGYKGELHHKIFGSKDFGDVVICFGDFRRGVDGTTQHETFPQFLEDFALGRNSKDISDLCGMSKNCAEGETSDRELSQLISLAKRYHGKLSKVWYCGDRCTLNYSPAN